MAHADRTQASRPSGTRGLPLPLAAGGVFPSVPLNGMRRGAQAGFVNRQNKPPRGPSPSGLAAQGGDEHVEAGAQVGDLAFRHLQGLDDRPAHLDGLLLEGVALLGQADLDLALVGLAPGAADEAGGLEALEHRRQGSGIEAQAAADVGDGQAVVLPQHDQDEVLRIGQAQPLEQRPVALRHAVGGRVERVAELVVEPQSGHA